MQERTKSKHAVKHDLGDYMQLYLYIYNNLYAIICIWVLKYILNIIRKIIMTGHINVFFPRSLDNGRNL